VTLHLLSQIDEALVCYDYALTLNPDYVDGHFNKALLHLLKGDYDAGWREYEWRWRRWKEQNLSQFNRDFTQPLWLGQTTIKGKPILLHSEQGFGETIQFCRYAPLVAGRGARVLLEVPAQLKDLMVSLAGVAEIIARQDKPPDFDLHLPVAQPTAGIENPRRVDSGAGALLYRSAGKPEKVDQRSRAETQSANRPCLVWRLGPQGRRFSVYQSSLLAAARRPRCRVCELAEGTSRR
jgi:TPR repeat